MDIEKLIAQITEEVYNKISSDTSFSSPAISKPSEKNGAKNINKYIDHTLLKADATQDQIQKVCDEARKYNFASVCVNTCWVSFVTEQLRTSGVKTCCVVGFPLGAMSSESKAKETADAIRDGANEVDMVINIGAAKSGNWAFVKKDIEEVVLAARGKALVKVIIETCLLTDEEKVKACTAAKLAGADYVKTSTGFSTGGATVDDIRLMRKTVGPDMGVKASGGVGSYKEALAMIDAGATRLGTSKGAKIIAEANGEAVPAGASCGSHECINCGACKKQCPTGNVSIIRSDY